MTEKHCLKCSHCNFSPGKPGYSEYTPGSPMHFYCHKGRWSAEDVYGARELGKTLSAAATCELYEEEK